MTPRIAVIGDHDPRNPTHAMTDAALGPLGLAWEWIATDALGGEPAARLAAFDGVWIGPGSPYRSMDGALEAIRFARERGVPLVGT
jgi:CTP synthase (UTP-ammonia lyase)